MADGALGLGEAALTSWVDVRGGSLLLFTSALRESMSRTGVEACSLRLASAFVTETAALVGVPRRGPMPRASARLLAMDDCGRRRREGARVGDVAEVGGD